ncbi:LysR substrate-binding domain-containing protein [Saccharomonospora sp. NPDC046836]|uniref:LysR family transcriptional regulator n=1 Tax=Saccharomonospora sp. NPDC046836 TaxID=3156921 RepID=UPI0033E1C1FA
MATSLELDHLRTLVAIAECGGFSKAAAALHISQPALSQHVRLLERGLKRKLFVKDGRGMRFTPEGERVLSEARQILAVHDEALARLRVRPEQTIVVGSSEHSAEQLLPELIRALNAAFPGAQTRFEIGRSTQLADSVAKGVVDFAVILASRGNEGGREIGRFPLSWWASPDWQPPAERDSVPLVAFEEPCALRERALAALSTEGYRVTVAGQSTTLEGVLAGVRAGLGVALLPSIGGAPAGLVARDELPAVGTAGVNLLARQGLDPEVELTALEAGEAFLAAAGTGRRVIGGDEVPR